MPSQGSVSMKWSLTGWSDWTYYVQNEMSEVGLQGIPASVYPPFMGEDHQKEKQRQRSYRQEHLYPGWIWYMLPFAVVPVQVSTLPYIDHS